MWLLTTLPPASLMSTPLAPFHHHLPQHPSSCPFPQHPTVFPQQISWLLSIYLGLPVPFPHRGFLTGCATKLCGVFQHIFSLSLMTVPDLWKRSCLVPSSKKKLQVPKPLHSSVKQSQNPLQFAYQCLAGVEDAVIFLLNRAFNYLKERDSSVRVMFFFSFSSACNTL